MAPQKISATEASRSFSDLLNRVKYAGEEFLVEKAGVPFCRIVPVEGQQPLTLGALARIIEERGGDTSFADAIEEAVNLGNAPAIPEDPWTR